MFIESINMVYENTVRHLMNLHNHYHLKGAPLLDSPICLKIYVGTHCTSFHWPVLYTVLQQVLSLGVVSVPLLIFAIPPLCKYIDRSLDQTNSNICLITQYGCHNTNRHPTRQNMLLDQLPCSVSQVTTSSDESLVEGSNDSTIDSIDSLPNDIAD